MSNRHVALLVEDHEPTAAAVKERLASMGFDVLHASTQEEALALVERGGFCFALLDLQIKRTAESIEESVEAGEAVVFAVRNKYPAYNDGLEMHWLPILVMSGYAKDPLFLVQMVKRGADEYLFKSEPREPTKPNMPDSRITERIVNALERSGRKSHAGCADANRRAVTRPAECDTSAADGDRVVTLTITGRLVESGNSLRNQVVVGKHERCLPNSSFVVLMHLVGARVTSPGGWAHKDSMGGERASKRLSDLRKEVQGLAGGADPIEGDKRGSYRLNPCISVEVDGSALTALLEHEEVVVRKLAAAIKGHRSSVNKAAPASSKIAIH
jgi:ActR/RegA family two-component response regulator